MTKRAQARGGMLVVVLLVVASCGGDAEAVDNGSDGVLVEGTSRVINVETTTVERQEFVEVIRLTGIVMADKDVTISAEESGVIQEILVEKGSAVRAGQALVRIDDAILKGQVEEAAAQAALDGETWERRKRLYEEDQVGSELAYLEAMYSAEQSAARLSVLQVRLAKTVVRTPLTGLLEMRMVEIGTMVNVGTPVARVVSLNPIKVVAGVPERYAADVEVGAVATVFFDVLDVSAEGVLSYVGATVDPGNRTFLIELEMANPDGAVKPQMVANVAVVRQSISDAIVVSQEALVRVETGFVAYVVEGAGPDAQVVARVVVTGASQQNGVVIEEGLEPGDQLVVVGQQQVAEGDRVTVVGSREGR